MLGYDMEKEFFRAINLNEWGEAADVLKKKLSQKKGECEKIEKAIRLIEENPRCGEVFKSVSEVL